MRNIRTVERSDSETYVNLNDLLLYLLSEKNDCPNADMQLAYQLMIEHITEIRDEAHQPKG